MIGVLFCRARTKIPMLLCTPALAYTVYHAKNFSTNFVWENLPFTEESFHTHKDEKEGDAGLHYTQPEWFTEDVDLAGNSRRRRSSHAPQKLGYLKSPRFIGDSTPRGDSLRSPSERDVSKAA